MGNFRRTKAAGGRKRLLQKLVSVAKQHVWPLCFINPHGFLCIPAACLHYRAVRVWNIGITILSSYLCFSLNTCFFFVFFNANPSIKKTCSVVKVRPLVIDPFYLQFTNAIMRACIEMWCRGSQWRSKPWPGPSVLRWLGGSLSKFIWSNKISLVKHVLLLYMCVADLSNNSRSCIVIKKLL